MQIEVENIADNTVFEYIGDICVTGDIGKNVILMITDGCLTVQGNIGDNSEFTLLQSNQPSSYASTSSTLFNNNDDLDDNLFVRVDGNLGNAVKVIGLTASIVINGNVGNNCELITKTGDISTDNVGDNTLLKTISGKIIVGDVGASSILSTIHGYITARNVGSMSSLTSTDGDIDVDSIDNTSTLYTADGKVFLGGDELRRVRAAV